MKQVNAIVVNRFEDHLTTLQNTMNYMKEIDLIGHALKEAVNNGHRIFFCGNGGSAADAQHLAAELVGRYKKERCSLPGLALTTDTSALTAIGNDYSFNDIFARQIEGLGQSKDVLIGISTSGNSKNVVKAIEKAKSIDMITVGFTGEGGGKMADLCDYLFAVPSSVTARIQEMHILAGHIICEIIEEDYD